MADRPQRPALLVLALLIGAGEAQAQSSASSDTTKAELERKKEKIVVTASRKEQLLEEVPASVSVLGSEELALSPADNVADRLRSIPINPDLATTGEGLLADNTDSREESGRSRLSI